MSYKSNRNYKVDKYRGLLDVKEIESIQAKREGWVPDPTCDNYPLTNEELYKLHLAEILENHVKRPSYKESYIREFEYSFSNLTPCHVLAMINDILVRAYHCRDFKGKDLNVYRIFVINSLSLLISIYLGNSSELAKERESAHFTGFTILKDSIDETLVDFYLHSVDRFKEYEVWYKEFRQRIPK